VILGQNCLLLTAPTNETADEDDENDGPSFEELLDPEQRELLKNALLLGVRAAWPSVTYWDVLYRTQGGVPCTARLNVQYNYRRLVYLREYTLDVVSQIVELFDIEQSEK
jgi:hypothetical protein